MDDTAVLRSATLNAEALYQELLVQVKLGLAKIASQTSNSNNTNSRIEIAGIYSGGVWLAERLASDLALKQPIGMIDVSFYRDDYAQKGLHAENKASHIPFNVEQAHIILVDDVLYTGRTTRAAINELFDYGRPASILLATLVDRGGRELPIAADFVAHTEEFEKSASINLHRADDGTLSLAIDYA